MRKTKNEEFSQEVPRFRLLLFVKAWVVYRLRRKRRCRFQHLSAAGPEKAGSCLGAWCSSTKGQGFAGREAPRRAAGTHVWAWGRGARRRRDKGLRGVKHHAGLEEGRFGPGGVVPVDEGTRVCGEVKHHAGLEEGRFEPRGVVPVDEGTRVCGERSTTPDWRKAGSSLGAWCLLTKEQGFAGREAPRRIGGRPVRTPNRPAPPPDGIKKRSCYSSSATS